MLMIKTEKTGGPRDRRWAALCHRGDFSGMYFRTFTLPHIHPQVEGTLENTEAQAAWYFLNCLNPVACIFGCFPAENLEDVQEQEEFGSLFNALLS